MRISSSERNRPKTNLGKLSMCDALDSFLPASKPELPRESRPDSLHIFIWLNSWGAQGVGKLREFFAKLRQIRAIEVMEELQNALDGEGCCEIVSTRDNFGKRLEFDINLVHELRKS
jgi:hypothetical protein